MGCSVTPRPEAGAERGRVEAILVISLTGIGNTLLFTPALQMLRRLHPDARIDALVEGKGSRDILEGNPDVNHILDLRLASTGLRALTVVRRLRDERYDLSITTFPSNRPRFNVFTWMIGARERVIHSYPDSRGQALTFLQTKLVPAQKGMHDIVQNMRLVCDALPDGIGQGGRLPRPILHLREEDRDFAKRYLDGLGRRSCAIAMHPGSSAGRLHQQGAKRWPAGNFCRAALLLEKELDAAVMVMCGPDEEDLYRRIGRFAADQHLRNVHFPKGTIRQMAGIVERCDALISSDTGLMHIATAVKTPVIALFGPTNPERTGPVWEECTILMGAPCACRPCLRYPLDTMCSSIDCADPRCWQNLTPERVVEEVKKALVRWRPRQ